MHSVPMPVPDRPGRVVVDLTDPRLAIPPGIHGLLVTTVVAGRGQKLEGTWLTSPDWTERHDGDVVATTGSCHAHDAKAEGIHLELYLVHDAAIHPLGSWCRLGAGWTEKLRGPAGTIIALHALLEEVEYSCAQRLPGPAPRSPSL